MTRRSFACCAVVVAAACSPPAHQSTAVPAAAGNETPKASIGVHCYERRMPDGSILSFHYADYAGGVVGILDYDFKEKDGAHGTLDGRRQDDIITAVWTRAIEGTTERQEVLIRLDPERAVKANGELTTGADGVLRLRDRSSATFNEAFERVQCD